MRPSAKLWLEERRRRLSTLPPEEEMRIQRLKGRLRLGGGTSACSASPALTTWNRPTSSVSDAAASLLDQNVALLEYVGELEEIYRHNEEHQARLREKLHEASDESRRCAMQIMALTLDKYRQDLLLEEQLSRERLQLHESDSRVELTLVFARASRSPDFIRNSRNDRTRKGERLLSAKQFYT
ncbi:hypothetical protein DQ04_09161020 [Trypanosoma grayi]|uniref:hypothetical protein n=1 Tax=Trypanosoma grayi TaxID=71804 RepID=UPI0004F4227E|nr:hypothetical protein DQ04_09161020 [Trypanosoma grayi]KEG07659.1 hypothetical protein DQ04_09161020 [Trypanosoma grayi]